MRLLSLDIFFTFNVHNVCYMAFIFLWNVPYDFYCVSWNVNFGFFKKDLQWALISFLTFLNSISDLFVKSILSYGMTSYTFQDFIKRRNRPILKNDTCFLLHYKLGLSRNFALKFISSTLIVINVRFYLF